MSRGSARSGSWIAAGIIGLLFLAGALPLIISDRGRGTARFDQNDYHLPVIRQFISQWPRPDLSNYNAAMTPGYHLLMAAAGHWFGLEERGMRWVSAIFTLGLLATFAFALSLRVGTWPAVALSLPLLCSQYVFTGGVWLVPHNAAWWCVLICLLICLRPVIDLKTYIGAGIALTLLVLFRQIHIWVAAPLFLAVWIGNDRINASPAAEGAAIPERKLEHRIQQSAWMVAAALPAFLILLTFYWLWHGTVPPMQRTTVGGGNTAVAALLLALAGIYGLFFSVSVRWRDAFTGASAKGARTSIAVGAVAGFLIAIIPRTDYSRDAGRWGGLWNIVAHLPTFAGRSPLIVALAALGGGILALWLFALPARSRWIFATALLAFAAAHSASGQAWQRYDEPLLLMVFPLMFVELNRMRPMPKNGARTYVGPVLLAVMLAGVTVYTLR